MNLFEIDFDEKLYENSSRRPDIPLFNDDDFSDMTAQADAIIENENETPQKRADACVRKFRLLETRRKLAPKLLEKALELYPGMPQALTSMGRFFKHTNENKKALEYFDKAADTDSSYPYVWLEKANFAEDDKEKIRFYSEFIKLKPDSKIGYEERGQLYEDELDERDLYYTKLVSHDTLPIILQVINDYSELIRLDPSNYLYHVIRARMHLLVLETINFIIGTEAFPSGINSDVLKDIRQIILLCSMEDTYNCIETVGDLFGAFPSKEVIIESITKIIDDLPHGSAAYSLAQVILAKYYGYDEGEKTIEIYSEVINSLEDGDLLRFYCLENRAQIYSQRKEFEKALADNAMIIKCAPLFPEVYHYRFASRLYSARENRAQLFEKMNDLSGAINECTLFLEELNNSEENYFLSQAYFRRAKLFIKNGEPDKALADYSAAIDLGQSVKDAYTARIEIYKARGEMDKAFADYIKMSDPVLRKEDDLGFGDFRPDTSSLPEYEILKE